MEEKELDRERTSTLFKSLWRLGPKCLHHECCEDNVASNNECGRDLVAL